MTVEELLTRMSSHELSEWMAFYTLEPFDEFRRDWRAAIIACTVANAHRGKKTRPYKVKDFLYNKPAKRAKSIEEQVALAQEITSIYEELNKAKEVRTK